MKNKSNTVKAVKMMRKIKSEMSREFMADSEAFFKDIDRLTKDFTSGQNSTTVSKPTARKASRQG